MQETTRTRWLRKLKTVPHGASEVGQRLLFYFSQMTIASSIPLDVVIPAADKDLDVLPYAIAGLRRNLRHPIGQIFVVTPPSARAASICRRQHCTHVDERSVLKRPSGASNLVVDGIDRSGWLYQQFLKWNADRFVGGPRFLVLDADTVLVRPQVMERNGRVVLSYADQFHLPYAAIYERLLKEPVALRTSFVSHHMLYETHLLQELRRRIEEANGCSWMEAVLRHLDRSQQSGFSEYETYGQYVFAHYPEAVAVEYWFNLALTRRNLAAVPWLGIKYGGRFKSVSFHHYAQQ